MTSWSKNMLYLIVRTQQLELSLQKGLGSNPMGARAFSPSVRVGSAMWVNRLH